MTGLTDYMAQASLNFLGGEAAMPALAARYLALFTAVGTDAGTGFTEVAGGAYARVQIAGTAATNNTTAAGNAILHFASVPAWVQPGMLASDTSASVVPANTTVLSVTTNTVTLSANVTGGGVGNGDTINFSAFAPPASGTAPSTITNGSIITFPQATASWGTIEAAGIYDASSGGNLLAWDFLGNFPWLPFNSTNVGSGAGPVFSAKANGFANLDPIVFSPNEYGGTLPTLTAGTITGYTPNFVANAATDSFTATQTSGGSAITSSTTGSGNVRKIVQQPIPINVMPVFAASTINFSAA